jgi:hypothetical protein
MNRIINKAIQNIKEAILKLISSEMSVLPLRVIRVTEKFDIVTRPPFRGGILTKE